MAGEIFCDCFVGETNSSVSPGCCTGLMSTQTTFCLWVPHWFPVRQCIWHASSGQQDTYSKLSKSLNITQPGVKRSSPHVSTQMHGAHRVELGSRGNLQGEEHIHCGKICPYDLPLTFSPRSFLNVLIRHTNPESVKPVCKDKPYIQPIFWSF